MKFRIAVLFIFTIIVIGGCSSTQHTFKKPTPLQSSIISYAKSFIDTPYKYAATGPSSFDCSGFTYFVFRKFGYDLPRSSRKQASALPRIAKNKMQIGDLVFFEGRRRNGRVGHVGIVNKITKHKGFNFIHASVNRGVTISNSKDSYYSKRFLKAARVIHSNSNNRLKESSSTKSQKHLINYKVVKGDSLYKIAKKFNCSISEIRMWNPGVQTLIHIGDELKIYTD